MDKATAKSLNKILHRLSDRIDILETGALEQKATLELSATIEDGDNLAALGDLASGVAKLEAALARNMQANVDMQASLVETISSIAEAVQASAMVERELVFDDEGEPIGTKPKRFNVFDA